MDQQGVALLRQNIADGTIVRVDLLKWHNEPVPDSDGPNAEAVMVKVEDLRVSIAGPLLGQVDWQAVAAALGGIDSWKVPVGDPRDRPEELRLIEVREHFSGIFGAEVFQDGLKVELVLHGMDGDGEAQAVTYGPYMSLSRANGTRVAMDNLVPDGYDGWGDLSMMAEGATIEVHQTDPAEEDTLP